MMHKNTVIGVLCLALVMFATTAFAQIGTNVLKTPPMHTSDVYTFPLEYHNPNDVVNWAGALMTVHVVDASEVDIDSLGTFNATGGIDIIPDPFGPHSENEQSVTKPFTVWDPLAAQSGIIQPVSAQIPVGRITVHAKNSETGGNSDTDIEIKFYNIHHVPPSMESSNVITLFPSEWVYGTPDFDPIELSELPSLPPEPGQGVWYHANDVKTFHLVPGVGSYFYAKFVTSLGIGIEHVPEPTSLVMLSSGIVCAGIGLWTRRRGRSAA